jgi:hypothetical protein
MNNLNARLSYRRAYSVRTVTVIVKHSRSQEYRLLHFLTQLPECAGTVRMNEMSFIPNYQRAYCISARKASSQRRMISQ